MSSEDQKDLEQKDASVTEDATQSQVDQPEIVTANGQSSEGVDLSAAGATESSTVSLSDESESAVESSEASSEVPEVKAEQPADEDLSPEASSSVSNEEVQQVVEAAEEVKKESPFKKDMAWFVVNAYSGFEMKVKRSLEERVRTFDMEDYFGEIHVPQETVVELVRGQKKTSNRKFFPGYILVEMVMNQDTWHLVKETPKVSGFVGDKTDPVPLSPDEVARIVTQVEEGSASPTARMKFEQGETVKVIDGPFAEFNGTVEEVKPDKGKLTVFISIFGRATPVELDFIQVEKC